MGDIMYEGFGAYVVTTIFDKRRARESSRMVHCLRSAYKKTGGDLGLPAILYLGVDAPNGIDEIGFLVDNEYYSGDRIDDVVARIREAEEDFFGCMW
jgi:hypothetical protein